MSDTEELRVKVTQKIDEVEQAVQSLQLLRKTLLQKAYETKQSILTAFINERDSLQCKEVRLLGEVDSLHHSKDDAVVIQLTKLNQVLGCLRNCLQSDHPCGDCLEKYEDLDMIPVTDISTEFTTASEQLKLTVYSSSSAQYPSHFQYPQAFVSKKEKEEDVMQWLVTPTNVDKHHHTPEKLDSCCVSTNQASKDSHVTEWLLEYHGNNPSSSVAATRPAAAEMGSIFTGVRLDDSENWLRSDVSYRQENDVGMFTETDQQFEVVTTQTSKDWLLQSDKTVAVHDGSESYSSVSSTSPSSGSTTSCASSSYVIIPSSRASVVTSYGDGPVSYWLSRESHQPTTPSPAAAVDTSVHSSADRSNVSEWLARCNSQRECSAQRSRLVSVTSLASDLLTVRTDTESLADLSLNCNIEWLLKPAVSDVNVTNRKFDGWLQSEITHDTESQVASDDWLTVRSKQQPSPEYDSEEKHDVIAEKSETSYWLRGSVDGDDYLDERWLLTKNQKMGDNLSASKKTCLNKDWLMTENRMTQISGSEHSGWLIDPSTA